jgi:hypothetical protein
MEDEDQYEKDMQLDDTVADEDMRYESDENRELKPKEKPVSPPLHLVVPFKQPPARPDKLSYCHTMIHLIHLWPHTIAVIFLTRQFNVVRY